MSPGRDPGPVHRAAEQAGELRVLPDAAALARAAAEQVAVLGRQSVASRGVFHLALSGGSTPRAAYALLARLPEAELAPWHAWFGDERCVPPEHPESNYRMALESGLLARIPPPQVHRMRGEADPAEEARRYELELREHLGSSPRLDLVLLGLGEDGHTASLFPGTQALSAPALVTVGHAPVEPRTRLSLTLAFLAEARSLLFLVSGAAKAPALARARSEDGDVPARRVRPRAGELLWLVDRAAAAS